MSQKLLDTLIEIYTTKNPQNKAKAKGAFAKANYRGYVTLRDTSGNILLKTKIVSAMSELHALKSAVMKNNSFKRRYGSRWRVWH